MKLKELISTDAVYVKAENEIRDWVEEHYLGLSIEFEPHLELVRTDNAAKFTRKRVRKITEVVNIKIGEVLEKHAEEIYIAERLDRIYKAHPEFDLDVQSIAEIKENRQFLTYLQELTILRGSPLLSGGVTNGIN